MKAPATTQLIPLPSGYKIRPMKVADIDDVLLVERDACPSTWTATGYTNELTRNSLATYHVLLRDDGQLVGYVGHWTVAGEAQISMIAVTPELQGNGLGALLLIATLLHAMQNGATSATLEVRASNLAAQRLYARFQFATVGRRHNYYKDTGDDALLMTAEPLDPAYHTMLIAAANAIVAT